MIVIENVFKRAKAKFGGKIMNFELEEETLHLLYSDAIKKFTLYSDLSNRPLEKIELIKDNWIESYFSTNIKEALGNVRGKYSGEAPVPGADLKIEYKHLLEEAIQERKALIRLIIDNEYKGNDITKDDDFVLIAVYLNVGDAEHEQVSEICTKVTNMLSEGTPAYVKHYVLPVKNQETRIELVYPISLGKEKEKIYDIVQTLKDMDEKLKLIYPTDEKQD
jgi:hypothetical protein